MSTFDETQVKRQSAGTSTGGQFAEKQQSAPSGSLGWSPDLPPHALPPRPSSARGGVTRVGAAREEYSATVEGRPPMFIEDPDDLDASLVGNPLFLEWAARADEWALKTGTERR
jgi:hypothetical protein